MFTSQQRLSLRRALLKRATEDARISGAAITGSAAAGKEDAWSDIDLAFGIRDAASLDSVVADWTSHMYQANQVVQHFDVRAGSWLYRVFLLATTLQVDLAFVPAVDFRPLASTFQLESGEAAEAQNWPPPEAHALIGMAWLYALHVRSAIERGKLWQAEHMIAGLRNQTMTLACLRLDLPTDHGRGYDRLPDEMRDLFLATLPLSLEVSRLRNSFQAAIQLLLAEVNHCDTVLCQTLTAPLSELAHH